jgi:predicted amidohydrolase
MATRKTAKFLTVAAAQMKFHAGIHENLKVIRAMTAEAASAKCDVVLFPECALTGYNVDFGTLNPLAAIVCAEALSAIARENRINLIVGAPTFDGDNLFNSLLIFNRRGREIFRYHKIHLTSRDALHFKRGNRLAYFKIDGVPCTAIICHERRYPELVRLPVMLGAQIVFHANAGLDSLAVSETKRDGCDGIAVRAFENQIYYVFANSVGPQGGDLWSAGDSKIVAPDLTTLALANNTDEALISARLDLSAAGRTYATEVLQQPAFLRKHWKAMLAALKRQLRDQTRH